MAAANLRAHVYGIPENRDRAAITKMVEAVTVEEFVPKSGVKIATTEAEAARNDGFMGRTLCIVLYCIMRPYTEDRLDHYRIGIPRELSEIQSQSWLSERSLTCDPCHHRGPIF